MTTTNENQRKAKAMTELIQVRIGDIDPSPFRNLTTYPYVEKKIETLRRSVADVGLWEGAIGRRHGNRFQLAFAHHRIEAARREGLEMVPLLVRDDLDDEKMLAFAARENSEDFNSDFLAQFELWEAAVTFRGVPGKQVEAIEIAGLLGWTRAHGEKYIQLNDTASACHAALALIQGGHLSRADLAGMAVDAVRLIVERTQSRIETLEKMGAMGKRPRAEIEASKKNVASAAKSVARDVRAGNIRQKDARGEIDFREYKHASQEQRQSPLFAGFAKKVAESIHKMLSDDTTAEKLSEMAKSLHLVSMDEDFQALRRVDFALAELEHKTGTWRERLTPKGKTVVPFKLLRKGGEKE